jgi:hypothetical protein
VLHILPLSASTSLPRGPARIVHTSLPVTAIRFIAERPGKYICAYRSGVGVLDEESGEVEVRRELIGGSEEGWTMNDGAVDPQGRFWFGEVDLVALGKMLKGEEGGRPRGRLWRFDVDGKATEMADGCMVGNGIGWSPDGRYSEFISLIFWRASEELEGTNIISSQRKCTSMIPGRRSSGGTTSMEPQETSQTERSSSTGCRASQKV